MAEFTNHKPGTFNWVDHSALDLEQAKQFYCDLFDWSPVDQFFGEKMVYTNMQIDKKNVAGMSSMPPPLREQNYPPFWMTYVCVENAKAICDKAKEFGGTVMMDAMDVMEEGVLGVIADPSGAVFGLWQPKNHKGTAFKYSPNSLCWVEHSSKEPEKAITFYEKLFGWTAKTMPMGGMDYTILSLGEEMVAGLFKLPPDMEHIPSNWLPYFEVDNIDAKIEKSVNKGSIILLPKTHADGVGHFSVIKDPQGGVFGIVESEQKM